MEESQACGPEAALETFKEHDCVLLTLGPEAFVAGAP